MWTEKNTESTLKSSEQTNSWRGEFQYLGKWYPMTFTAVDFNGEIKGSLDIEGHDEYGQFRCKGGFVNETNDLEFIKHYSFYSIFYKGTLQPADPAKPPSSIEISGFWGYQYGGKFGAFRLYRQ